MNAPIILLHEEALRSSHPVFTVASHVTNAVFIWDNDYFRQANYSLKRLVFIYETLCELSINIIPGDTKQVISTIAPSIVYVPLTHNPVIKAMIDTLGSFTVIRWVADDKWVNLGESHFKRFFKYWEKTRYNAFKYNGSIDAQGS
jgi:hypothetical protein